jgi:predicted transposase/invertase (TIGR01784 family)
MAKIKTSRTRKKAVTAKDLGVYINLLTDFGFKRVFGIKEVMITFLNTVLDIEGGIKDLRYGNPEKLGFSQYDRKAVYDLYCITGNDEHIIVEIQSSSQVYFKDRTLLYASRLINEQSEKGKDWNFELPKVYSVNILDFTFEEALLPLGIEIKRTDENKYVSKVQLIDCDTKELFYDKLTFVYIELPCFTKELKDLKTFFEQWIFIIKHLHELNDLPEKFRKDEVFEKLFETAKIARMTKNEVNNYLKDLNNMNIVRNEIRTRDNIIANHVNTIAKKDNTIANHVNTIAEQSNINAEYERRYGVLHDKRSEL